MKPFSIKPLNSFQIIVLGFAGVILAGALLLMLPVSSATHCVTPFLSALFTSTTSVCVTGLIVVDTGTYWSVFGQAVILVLIQIGGMGVVTVAAAVTIVSGRKIGLMQRSTMQEAVAAPKMSGIVRLTGFIIRATLLIELSGAALLAPVFCRDFGPIRGLWMAVFHSISAFCNAGIDLMGIRIPFSSLTLYAASPLVNLVIMALIIIGGIGFAIYIALSALEWRGLALFAALAFGLEAGYAFLSALDCREKDKDSVSYNIVWGTGALAILMLLPAVMTIIKG